jgi:hypothetical protein
MKAKAYETLERTSAKIFCNRPCTGYADAIGCNTVFDQNVKKGKECAVMGANGRRLSTQKNIRVSSVYG